MAQKRVLMKGNEVIAEAALRAGCRNYFGYPRGSLKSRLP